MFIKVIITLTAVSSMVIIFVIIIPRKTLNHGDKPRRSFAGNACDVFIPGYQVREKTVSGSRQYPIKVGVLLYTLTALSDGPANTAI